MMVTHRASDVRAGRKDQKSAREITSNQRQQREPLQKINKKIIEEKENESEMARSGG